MKTLKYITIGLFGLLAACDSTSISNPTSPSTQSDSYTWTGHVDLSNAGTSTTKIMVAGQTITPDANGNYVISLPKTRVSARALGTESIVDTAKLIVNHNDTLDTLKEIPLKSWIPTLDSTSVVATIIRVKASRTCVGRTLEAVWWNNDSIAHVKLVRSIVNRASVFSGMLYSAYDAKSDSTGGVKAWIFLRFKDSVAQTLPTLATTVYGLSEGQQLSDLDSTDFNVPAQLDTASKIRVVFTAKDKQLVLNTQISQSKIFDTLVLNSDFDGLNWKTGDFASGTIISDSNITGSLINRNGTSYDALNAYKNIVVDFNSDTTASMVVFYIGGIYDTINVVAGHNRIVINSFQRWSEGPSAWMGNGAIEYFKLRCSVKFDHLQLKFVK